MSKADNTFQNSKVQLPQGADTLSIDSDGKFSFFGNEVTGENLNAILYGAMQNAVIANSAGVLSVLNIPANTRLVIFSMTDAASNASAWLTSQVKKGQQLTLVTRTGLVASVFISMSGVTLIGTYSGSLSSISLQCSAASQAYLHLLATADDTWSIIGINDSTVVQRGLA